MSPDLADYLRDKRALVDSHLRQAMKARDGCPTALREAMTYSLMAPGKRLRPILAVLACEACGGEDRAALPAGCAVEMVHTYSLIHDDLPAMDDDDLRRGLPTCHKKFGEALAILAGDALLTLAFEVVATAYPAATAAACCRELAKGAGEAGMVGGQVDDLAWEGRAAGMSPPVGTSTGGLTPAARLEDLESLHARKTGALFRAALRMGVAAALGERPGGAPAEVLERFDAYGRCFGQAFQITDDLLDVAGSAEQAGKRVHKDARRGKLTYPGLLGVADSRARAERLCREAGEHLAPLGPPADRLALLARSLADRDR